MAATRETRSRRCRYRYVVRALGSQGGASFVVMADPARLVQDTARVVGEKVGAVGPVQMVQEAPRSRWWVAHWTDAAGREQSITLELPEGRASRR